MQNTPQKYYVLIRTSGRPELFDRAIRSALSQTIKPEIIVSIDNENDLQYVSKYDCKVIRVAPRKEFETYWNLYLNFLIKQCDGFCLILDDDDYIGTDTLFERLPEVGKDEIIVYRMRWVNDRVIPGDNYFGKLPFTRKEIGMPCVVFHSDWIKKYQFDGHRAGDFRFFNKIQSDCKTVYFMNSVEIEIGNTGLNGSNQHNSKPGS